MPELQTGCPIESAPPAMRLPHRLVLLENPMRALGVVAFLIAMQFAAPETAFALGWDMGPKERAAMGAHCVHGYWVNESQCVYYAGDVALLNADLAKLEASSKDLPITFATRKIIIHAGTKQAASPWDKGPRDIPADWSVQTFDEPNDAAKPVPGRHLQVDIWIGSRLKLNDIQIPAGFAVESGGEIEAFVRKSASRHP